MTHAFVLALAVSGAVLGQPPEPEVVELRLTESGATIDRSCRVVIPEGMVFGHSADAPVIRVVADNIFVEFVEGSVLRGAAADAALDSLTGVGILVDGRHDVVLRNVRVSGFKAGIHAKRAKGLTIDGAEIAGNFAQHLKSTVQAEDSGDWLWPHKNDGNEWLKNYGAAIYIEDSANVMVHDVKVRRGQNGIVLDRVSDSKIYDNDCSFLSGWGLGMWRSSGNLISRNACDFCIRGYSHGVYNRGQDSAGILMFEQCSRNVLVENSATHSGDAFFGFAGREALGEDWMENEKARLATAGRPEIELVVSEAAANKHKRLGCNDNLLIGNDFSYSAAHGIEMTFSFGNRFIGNQIFSNAICGVWGGFSSGTLIAGNAFRDNGSAGYGAERGGINIEHGRDNRVVVNTFEKNALGVRLWSRADSPMNNTPWGKASGEDEGGRWVVPSARNTIAGNTFDSEASALVVRASTGTVYADNTATNVAKELDADAETKVILSGGATEEMPEVDLTMVGSAHPLGARAELDGRENIIMGEWGPWDHASPMLRLGARDAAKGTVTYEVFGVGESLTVEPDKSRLVGVEVVKPQAGAPSRIPATIQVDAGALGPGVWPYKLHMVGEGLDRTLSGTIVRATWSLTVFPWTVDPLKDVAAWRAEAAGPKAVTAEVKGIDFALGYRGPSAIGISPAITEAKFGANQYGMIAKTKIPLRAGKWAIRTVSDDGIRVLADGEQILEHWNIHGPTPDRTVLVTQKDGEVELTVEYFQNDGHAALSVTIEPADAKGVAAP